MLTKSIQEEDRVKTVVVNETDGNDVSIKGIKLVSDLAHRGARVEFHIECFGVKATVGLQGFLYTRYD